VEELKRLRNGLGWSQQRLADESGVNKATINQVEQGKRSPSIATLESLARAMGAEVGDFFPKVQAPLWPEELERRPSVLAEAVVAAADIWMREIQAPDASWQRIYQAGEKVLDLQDYISTRLEEDGWWKGLSEQERHDIVYVDRYLDALGSAVIRHQLGRRGQDAEQDVQHEDFARRREQIKGTTRRIIT